MPYLIGTDEAGYGPNLGPLTVTGTLWHVPDDDSDLYDCLETVVSKESPGRKIFADSKLHVADSKSVYQASRSIESLERSVLAILYSLRSEVAVDDRALLRATFSRCIEDRVALMAGENSLWSPTETFALPLHGSLDSLRSTGDRFLNACQTADIGLVGVRCQPVFPATFNRLTDSLGNKAHVLSSQTMAVISKLLKQTESQNVTIYCDKHGGRSRYLPLIQQHLTQQLVTVEIESRVLSRYHWLQADRKITIQFSVGGESQLAVALASMVSKYVREIFMHIWNEFWQDHIENLKPTKGYPVDAKRFMSDIENTLIELGIARSQIWRNR